MRAILSKLGLAAVATLAISGSANAAVTIAGFTANQLVVPPTQHLVDSFDDAPAAGFTLNLGSVGQILSGSLDGKYQAPVGDVSNYLAIMRDLTAVVTLAVPATTTDLSFYVGSIDTYNTVQFYNTSNVLVGTVTGTQMQSAAGGGQEGRFYFDLTGQNIGSVAFNSTQNAFEIENIAADVPEPGVWAMMMLGLGGLGYALRRRRFAVSAAATA